MGKILLQEKPKHLAVQLNLIKVVKISAVWLGPESNQRHMDFQSTALPTELPSHTQNRFDYIENRMKITWSIQQNKNI